MKTLSISQIICMCAFSILFAQLGFAQPSTSSEISVTFTDHLTGTSFDIPMGWVAHPISGGYLLQSKAYDGYVLVLPHSYRTKNALKAAYEHELNEEMQGIKLTRSTEFKRFNSRGISAHYEGIFAWREATCCVISLVSPYFHEDGTGGFHIISGSMDKGKFKYFCSIANLVASSVKFKNHYQLMVRR